MGYSVGRFVGDVDENLLCSICGAVLEDAVLTPCGHSFCNSCLRTWLDRPRVASCPQCRSSLNDCDIHPILSIRSLVHSLAVRCDNAELGCDVIMSLDGMANHRLHDCQFEPIQCAGCDVKVSRCNLRKHHDNCDVIAKILSQDCDVLTRDSLPFASGSKHALNDSTVCDLVSRVTLLEVNLQRVRKELDAADWKNKRMDRELRRAKEHLQHKRLELSERVDPSVDKGIDPDFDPHCDYGFTQASVTRLARFVARHISNKPAYVDAHKIFTAIERCYENFSHSCSELAERELLTLLTTAYASDWFTRSQRASLNCWLQSVSC